MATSKKPKPAPARVPGRATKPTYQRSKPEKLIDEVGKALRRMPSDLAKGGEMVRGAVETLKDRARRIRKGTK